jgi:hypothetical protein
MMNNIRNQKGFALLLSTIIILGGSLILAGGFLAGFWFVSFQYHQRSSSCSKNGFCVTTAHDNSFFRFVLYC